MSVPRPVLRPAAAAPLVLLLAALSTVFLFGNDRGHFYRPGHHDRVSAEHMAVAVNLSPAHHFLMVRYLNANASGYAMYNRFPVGGYALIALATSPFRGDQSLRLHAARMLMLGFFAAAAVLAYLATSRLAASRWTALTATLLAFSSYYGLYYNDMIHSQTMPNLFGVLLTFHGVVVFLQDGRFRQLLVKACAALLLGWHVLAVVAAFVVLGLARARGEGGSGLPRPRHCLYSVTGLRDRFCSVKCDRMAAADGKLRRCKLVALAARGEVPAAFERRCIPPDGVVRRLPRAAGPDCQKRRARPERTLRLAARLRFFRGSGAEPVARRAHGGRGSA